MLLKSYWKLIADSFDFWIYTLCIVCLFTEYLAYFAPDFSLHPDVATKQENLNTRQYLDTVKQFCLENLRHVAHAPSVQMHDVPPDLLNLDNVDEPDPDIRNHQDDVDRRYVTWRHRDVTWLSSFDNVWRRSDVFYAFRTPIIITNLILLFTIVNLDVAL